MTPSPNHKPRNTQHDPTDRLPPKSPCFLHRHHTVPPPRAHTVHPETRFPGPPGPPPEPAAESTPPRPRFWRASEPLPTRTPAPTRTIFQTTFPRLPLYSPHALRPHSEPPAGRPFLGDPDLHTPQLQGRHSPPASSTDGLPRTDWRRPSSPTAAAGRGLLVS